MKVTGKLRNDKLFYSARNSKVNIATNTIIKIKGDLKFRLSNENKMLRFSITDFTSSPQLQTVLIKLWKIMVHLQYSKESLMN
jgi:hypothetical protein